MSANHGVPVDTLFFPENYAPSIKHQYYQFDLDTNEGQLVLERRRSFVDDAKPVNRINRIAPC
jgi:hypothetical protein